MAHRIFTDGGGRLWQTWDTFPQNPQVVAAGFESGWLTFESDGERRRLAPVPNGWADAPDTSLTELLATASPARRTRLTPPPPENPLSEPA